MHAMDLRRPLVTLSLFIALAATSASCRSAHEDSQPAPRVTTFARGLFDEIPRLPGTSSLGARSEKNEIVTQTFRVEGRDPHQVIEFYDSRLPSNGWLRASPAYREPSTNRADFVRDDYRLEVSSALITNAGSDDADAVASQYSLVLRPR